MVCHCACGLRMVAMFLASAPPGSAYKISVHFLNALFFGLSLKSKFRPFAVVRKCG